MDRMGTSKSKVEWHEQKPMMSEDHATGGSGKLECETIVPIKIYPHNVITSGYSTQIKPLASKEQNAENAD